MVFSKVLLLFCIAQVLQGERDTRERNRHKHWVSKRLEPTVCLNESGETRMQSRSSAYQPEATTHHLCYSWDLPQTYCQEKPDSLGITAMGKGDPCSCKITYGIEIGLWVSKATFGRVVASAFPVLLAFSFALFSYSPANVPTTVPQSLQSYIAKLHCRISFPPKGSCAFLYLCEDKD